jgi:P27 family predicted phage terminase small subunit
VPMTFGRRGGPRPKPTHLKLIQGNPGKRKLNKHEPQPTRGELPDPPDYLNDDAKDEWKRVAAELYHSGVLTKIDHTTLAAYCQCFGRWMQAERGIRAMAADNELHGLIHRTTKGEVVQNPLVRTARHAAADMMRYATEFGLTPSARARLEVGPTPPQSKFSGLFGGED